MTYLERIKIEGFKSIREMSLELRPLNVLVGANGAGKSNFISAFRFLNEMLNENLSEYVGRYGGSDKFLYFGQKTTERLKFELLFEQTDSTANAYNASLAPSVDDTFVYLYENISFHDRERYSNPYRESLGPGGYKETKLPDSEKKMANYVISAMQSWRVYHFHDTSRTAKIKQMGDLHDNEYLRVDGSNLAAYLYLLQEVHPNHYRNIVDTVRMVAPFFDDFNLRPSSLNPDKIRLEWHERGSDMYFDGHDLSDGTLRFISLTTLLLQPREKRPQIIILDEPELGLHPYAITLLAGLLESTSIDTQIILATQSTSLVNQFSPEDLIVVEREDGQSIFKRLSEEQLENWLEEYSLGELWEKNVLGGRPTFSERPPF